MPCPHPGYQPSSDASVEARAGGLRMRPSAHPESRRAALNAARGRMASVTVSRAPSGQGRGLKVRPSAYPKRFPCCTKVYYYAADAHVREHVRTRAGQLDTCLRHMSFILISLSESATYHHTSRTSEVHFLSLRLRQHVSAICCILSSYSFVSVSLIN